MLQIQQIGPNLEAKVSQSPQSSATQVTDTAEQTALA
jgi:hypothetical protein